MAIAQENAEVVMLKQSERLAKPNKMRVMARALVVL